MVHLITSKTGQQAIPGASKIHGIDATKTFQGRVERLQKQDIIAPLGVDETSEWCNSFMLVPKANGKVRLCLDPAQLNQALIRLVHSILPKLNNAKYLSLIDASSGYHNIKLDKNHHT